MKRKVRKDFNPAKEYIVDVSNCSEDVKEEVQQAFFDVGIEWVLSGKVYKHPNAAQYTNVESVEGVSSHLMYGDTTEDCNMTAEEFINLVYEPEKKGHIYAELMARYAEDAKLYAEPWKLWQIKAGSFDWIDCQFSPGWDPSCEFRRKPKTHIVNGVEVPDLRFTPKFNEAYCYPSLNHPALTFRTINTGAAADEHRIKNDLCYEISEEGKQAAKLHAKAMLGISEYRD